MCDKIPDCLEAMHCRITCSFSWSDGLAEVQLPEVLEENVVDVPHLVWPGIGASTPDHCSILSWYADFSVPQSSLDHTMHRITLHLCV